MPDRTPFRLKQYDADPDQFDLIATDPPATLRVHRRDLDPLVALLVHVQRQLRTEAVPAVTPRAAA